MFPTDTTTIDTLRVRGSNENSPALHLALSSMLSNADFRLAGISPSAILIVKKLSDPLPGQLKPRPGVMQVDATWERAVQSSLSRIYHQAARPVNGYIPSNADAVLFADEGEMLACLTLDMSGGEATGRWWWKVVLRSFPSVTTEGLTDVLCGRAIYIPAVLHYMEDWGKAESVVHSLSSTQAMTVISAMSREFGIADFRTNTVPETPGSGAEIIKHAPGPERINTEPEKKIYDKEKKSPQYQFPRIPSFRRTAPWEGWLPSRPFSHGTGREHACLLGLGLSLYHQPGMVQTNDFMYKLRTWWEYQQVPSTDKTYLHEPSISQLSDVQLRNTDQNESLSNSKDHTSHTILKRTDPEVREPDTYDTSTRFISESTGNIPHPMSSEFKSEEMDEYRCEYRPKKMVNKVTGLTFHETIEIVGQQRLKNQPDEVVKTQEKIFETGAQPLRGSAAREEGMNTRLAGVFYLINLMQQLDLPACFEKDWGLASQVGTWGVLDILGRALLGEIDEQLAQDPLWDALAQLSGRGSGELPGDTFYGTEVFRLPAQWLQYVASNDSMFYWAADGNRLRLWSEQYILVDCPLDMSTPEEQARNELRTYTDNTDTTGFVIRPFHEAPVGNINGNLVEGLNTDLTGWLIMVIPFIRFLLSQALNLADFEKPDIENVLLCPGRLYVTSIHVDLVMDMNDISLPVRMAGLDSNPGWLADFGRVVRFHFE